MAEDWLADVRRYDADADETVVAKIVRHCGIALRTRDASLVAFSDSKETGRVRDGFLRKKLARTEDDAVLDAAIASVGERMREDHDKNRVTVYYLLAQHFGQLDLFAGTAGTVAPVAVAVASTTTAASSGAATSAPAASIPPASAPTPTAPLGFASSGAGGTAATPGKRRGGAGGDDFMVGCFGGLAVLGAVIAAMLISIIVEINILPEPAPEPVAVTAPAPPPEPAVPEGAGVVASERDGFPMLTVYFDTGSAEVTPDFEAVSADLRSYLDANPDASVQISGFNDPSGDAELNAALSRDRAMGVQAAMVALGLDEARTDLVRPDDTTTTDMTAAEARRVEITVTE